MYIKCVGKKVPEPVLPSFWKTMKKAHTDLQEPKEVIYRGVWQGLGKMYSVWVDDGYTTIIVKPGEDVKRRSTETKEKFARQE